VDLPDPFARSASCSPRSQGTREHIVDNGARCVPPAQFVTRQGSCESLLPNRTAQKHRRRADQSGNDPNGQHLAPVRSPRKSHRQRPEHSARHATPGTRIRVAGMPLRPMRMGAGSPARQRPIAPTTIHHRRDSAAVPDQQQLQRRTGMPRTRHCRCQKVKGIQRTGVQGRAQAESIAAAGANTSGHTARPTCLSQEPRT